MAERCTADVIPAIILESEVPPGAATASSLEEDTDPVGWLALAREPNKLRTFCCKISDSFCSHFQAELEETAF